MPGPSADLSPKKHQRIRLTTLATFQTRMALHPPDAVAFTYVHRRGSSRAATFLWTRKHAGAAACPCCEPGRELLDRETDEFWVADRRFTALPARHGIGRDAETSAEFGLGQPKPPPAGVKLGGCYATGSAAAIAQPATHR